MRLLVVAWGSLAIYYSNLPWWWLRLTLAVAFAALGVWALGRHRGRRACGAFAAVLTGVVLWEISISASHERAWRAEVAVMPRAFVDGDHVRLEGVRDFAYRSEHDFTVRYVVREVSLSRLNSVDFYVSYWMPGPVAHTFVSFNFDDADPVAISIETRPEEGEAFNPLASLFKQFEPIYVVSEERDIVGVRTNHRDEAVYLYPLRVAPEAARRLFLVYLERINSLAERPEWYHLIKSNCTINIVRYARAAGRTHSFDLRHYLNGWADRYLYDSGLLSRALPFETLRARSRINEQTEAAGSGPEFSRRIRSALPGNAARSETQ
ncbi:MAG TPA: DUF4105 domain-containing protein [Burkholderiales bacterium]